MGLGDSRLGDSGFGDSGLGDSELEDSRLGDLGLGDLELGDLELGDLKTILYPELSPSKRQTSSHVLESPRHPVPLRRRDWDSGTSPRPRPHVPVPLLVTALSNIIRSTISKKASYLQNIEIQNNKFSRSQAKPSL